MTTQADEPQPFRLEGVQRELRQIPLSSIDMRPDDYSFRAEEDLTEGRLDDFLEDVKAQRGIHTPLLVRILSDGRFLLLDGHRRFTVLGILVRQRVEGFHANMEVPAVVITSDCSELDMLAMLASSNIQRKSLDAEGRQWLAFRLHQEGMPKDQIAKLLGVSTSTVDRDVTLGADPRMMEHVRLNHIGATDAARLVKLARDKDRYDEFMEEFERLVDQVQERLEEEAARQADQDEGSLFPIERWPQAQFTRDQIGAWTASLNSGTDFREPSFRYRASLKREKGQQRIVVDPLDKDVFDLTAQDVAKLYQRFVDLSAELEPVLRQKG